MRTKIIAPLFALLAACTAGDAAQDTQVLPIQIEAAGGGEMLAGTYDTFTGEVWLTQNVMQGIAESLGETTYEANIAGQPIDWQRKGAIVDVDLSSGHTLEIRALSEDATAVNLATMKLAPADWISSLSEEEARTSFPRCDAILPELDPEN